MNEYKPLKLDTPTVPAQGTAFATKGSETKKKSSKGAAAGGKYLKAAEWNALSSDEQQKIIESRSKSKGDDDDKSTSSSKSIKSLSKTLLFWLEGQIEFGIIYIHTQLNTTVYVGITTKKYPNQAKKRPSHARSSRALPLPPPTSLQ
jgi:hypothetical protein